MSQKPEFTDVEVEGGRLKVAKWGSGPKTVLGIHGITASSLSLAPVSRHLGPEFTLIAPDLRGRGGSNALPEPYGLATHATDCAAVIEALALPPITVLGESMGAWVAVALAALRPDLVQGLVLADGGLPQPLPPELDHDLAITVTLGPALERLKLTFESLDTYREFWKSHPAFVDTWSDDLEAYIDYDLAPVPEGGFRSRTLESAVRADGKDVLDSFEKLGPSFESLKCPVTLIRAPRNLLDQPTPLLGDDLVELWQQRLPQLQTEMVDDVNHYTLFLTDRGSKTLAEHVTSMTAGGSAAPATSRD